MIPRSGGEKVYLEAVYKRPRLLATTVYAVNTILLSFSSANCIVRISTTTVEIHSFNDASRSLLESKLGLVFTDLTFVD